MTRWRVLTFVTLWVAVTAMLLAADAEPAVFVIGGVIAAAMSCVFVVADSGWLTEQMVWSGWRRPAASLPVADARSAALERHAREAVRSGSTTLHATLLQLLDEALLERHGVDRVAAPTAADALLTPSLRRLAAGPDRRIGSPRELRRIIDELEVL